MLIVEAARPQFCKAYQVPFALQEAIEKELEYLEKMGILQKVDLSEWATPIITVQMKDEKERL